MAICLLVRHGRTSANATGILAGWTPGLGLDERGRAQAELVGRRLAGTGLAAIVASPLQRCQETARAIAALAPTPGPATHLEESLAEARYGAWTGRPLSELAQEPLWADVQERPSTVSFPAHPEHEHEGMLAMQERAVDAVRSWDARVEAEHGPGAIWVAVSHGDVIKAVLADALGAALDDFQRIVVDPASVSIVHRTPSRPFVLRTNDTGTDPVDLGALTARLREHGASGDAEVGGGAGSGSGAGPEARQS